MKNVCRSKRTPRLRLADPTAETGSSAWIGTGLPFRSDPVTTGPSRRGGSRVELGRSQVRVDRGPRLRRMRGIAVLMVLAIAATACGSRLPDDVLAEIDGDRASSNRDQGTQRRRRVRRRRRRRRDRGGAGHRRRHRRRRHGRHGRDRRHRRDRRNGHGCRGQLPGRSDGHGRDRHRDQGGHDGHRVRAAPRRHRGLLPWRAGLLREDQLRGRRLRPADHRRQGRRRARPAAGPQRVPPARAPDVRLRRQPGRGRLRLRRPHRLHGRPLRRHDRSTRPAGHPTSTPVWPRT